MNKLVFLFFLSIFGCIKLERLEERDKVFSYDDFRKLVKKEDIAEYLSKNEYDLKQELEQVRDILRILIHNDMETEMLVLLDKLNELNEEEKVEFFSIWDEKEALHLVVDKLWTKSAMKILDMYSRQAKQVKLGFGQGLNFTLLDRAVMNKNMQSLLFVLDLRREYAREIEDKYADGCTFKMNKKLSTSLENACDFVTARKSDKVSEVDKSIGEDSIFVTFLKECLKKRGIDGEVSIEEFLSNLEEERKKEVLIMSSCLEDEKVLSYLLSLGVKQDKLDESGNTALIYSSYYGRVEAAKILIRKGAAIDLANKDEETPLYIASQGGKKEVVELLLTKGAAVNLAMSDGSAPLYIASRNGHKEVVELLINKRAVIDLLDEDEVTPLYIASKKGHKEVVELLINKGAEVNLTMNYGRTPLYTASCHGHKEVVELLLSKGALIDLADEDGETPLYIASCNGHKEVVELLIEDGVDIDLAYKDGETLLIKASGNGHKEVVELLINKGAAIDLPMNNGVTPLYMASIYGNKEVIELLLTKGASIDLAINDGATPLYIASWVGHKEVVELLINKGAAIDLAMNDGATPLYIASWAGHKEVVELLIDKGASIDLARNDGETPLCTASFYGHKEVVELLLTKGASINLADEYGCTPIYIASQRGHKEVVKLLMSKGADINKFNLEGKSILEAALINEKEEVIEELLSSCFVEGEGIVLSSSSLIVTEGALNLFNREIRQNPISTTMSFAKIYRILNEVYSKQFIKEVERDLDKSCTTKLVEIMDEVRTLNEFNTGLNEKEANIQVDVSERFKYEIIDNLNKMFDKRSDLKVKPVYDKFKNSREVILNRRVKAGHYKDYTILMLEILKGDLDRVKELIQKGSDVNVADQNGNSCLALATGKNLKEVVELLITNGADINAVNKNGENALMIGIETNSVDMVKRLAPLTNMNHADIFTNTALMLAIKKIMRINPNFSDLEKRFKEIEGIINILIKSGSKVTKEVIDLLEEKKGDEVIEKLRLKLARIFKLDL